MRYDDRIPERKPRGRGRMRRELIEAHASRIAALFARPAAPGPAADDASAGKYYPVETVDQPRVSYPSVSTAAASLGVNRIRLGKAIRLGQRCCGRLWRYAARDVAGVVGVKGKPVESFDGDGRVVRYPSITLASDRMGVTPSALFKVIKRGDTLGGLRWRYSVDQSSEAA